jgi:hypothetical protein
VTGVAGVVTQRPVTELRVVAVGVEQRVGQIRLRQFTGRDRLGEPPLVGLAGEFQDPAGHRDRHPDSGVGGGKITDQRVDHFPVRCAWAK